MAKHQSMIVDHDVDVNLTLLVSLLIDLRDLVIESQDFEREFGVAASSPSHLSEELGNTLSSLRISSLLMICSAWLIERISLISSKALDGEFSKVREAKSLKEKFDDSGFLTNVPASEIEKEVHNVCLRLSRLDKCYA